MIFILECLTSLSPNLIKVDISLNNYPKLIGLVTNVVLLQICRCHAFLREFTFNVWILPEHILEIHMGHRNAWDMSGNIFFLHEI